MRRCPPPEKSIYRFLISASPSFSDRRRYLFSHPIFHRSVHTRRASSLRAVSWTLAALVCTVGGGCALVAPYHPPPPVKIGALASMTQPLISQQPLPDAWWQLYKDPALDALIVQALANNRDLAVAQAHLARSDAVLDAADAARLPDTNVAFGGNEGKQVADQTVASARRDGTTTRWAWTPSFSVSYEIDLWGRVRHLIDAAHADADALQAARDAVRVAVVAATTRSYAQACSYGAQIDVAQDAVGIAQHLADLTEKQSAQGLISDFDVARALGQVATSRAAIPALQGKRHAALAELAMLTGRQPSDVPVAASQCHTVPVLMQPFPIGDGAALLRRRPDLRQAERQLAAANARVGVATAAQYPSIVLGGAVDLVSATGSLASLGDRYAASWGIGPLISWRFPNMAVSHAALAQANADNLAARAAFDGSVLNALKETDQALSFYGTEWSRHRALQAACDQDSRALHLAQLNYQAGALDFLDVLDAERTLTAARAALAVSTGTLSTDQIAVFKALGGGWGATSTLTSTTTTTLDDTDAAAAHTSATLSSAHSRYEYNK